MNFNLQFNKCFRFYFSVFEQLKTKIECIVCVWCHARQFVRNRKLTKTKKMKIKIDANEATRIFS